jgi:lipopolysaccharide cholinephosphotransferase
MDVDIRKTQLVELQILKEFKRICAEYDLKYFAIGGTCIGAIRHHGFIPWDDDIDVAMPFEDYMKFLSIAKDVLQSPYALYDPRNTEHWRCNFVKIHDTSTTFVEENCMLYKERYAGVYIDIMPICGLPNGRIRQWVSKYYVDNKLLLNQNLHTESSDHPKITGKVLYSLIKAHHDRGDFDHFTKIIDKKYGRYKFDNSDRVIFAWRRCRSFINRNWNYESVFYYEDFADSVEVPFEDTTISVPKGYDRYLRMDFGDYMTLPPEAKQVPHHKIDIYDLDKPYTYYLNANFKEEME